MPRKIIARLATSADGFLARPDGSVEWLDRPRPKHFYGMGEFYKSVDTILLGRKTYDFALGFQEKSKSASVFDAKMKYYVFSRTLSSSAEGTELVKKPVKQFAQHLRNQAGKDIWMMGGAGIIGSFLDEEEIDEFIINVIPVFIGEGIPLIAPRHRMVPLGLISSEAFEDGVVGLHYSVRV